jgi:hypothetical protein
MMSADEVWVIRESSATRRGKVPSYGNEGGIRWVLGVRSGMHGRSYAGEGMYIADSLTLSCCKEKVGMSSTELPKKKHILRDIS